MNARKVSGTNRLVFEEPPPDFVTFAMCDICECYAWRSPTEGWVHELRADDKIDHRPYTQYVIEEEPV